MAACRLVLTVMPGRRMSSLPLQSRAGLKAGRALPEADSVQRLAASAGAGANPIG
jgi:hypothetical protein